jgi:hypothetical protein
MKTHKFTIGQFVNFDRGFAFAADGEYEIIKALPVEGAGPAYRIKSKKEAYERVAREDQLSATSN